MSKTKYCPCCGEPNDIEACMDTYVGRWYVICNHCGLRTDRYATRDEAIEKWNTRAEKDGEEPKSEVAQIIAHIDEEDAGVHVGIELRDADNAGLRSLYVMNMLATSLMLPLRFLGQKMDSSEGDICSRIGRLIKQKEKEEFDGKE